MQTMTETLQMLIGKPLVESTDQEIYLALLDHCAQQERRTGTPGQRPQAVLYLG